MSIENLLKTNVNEHTERKNNLTYLSWAWAWAEALKADPAATFKVETFKRDQYTEEPFMTLPGGTAMVWVTVTIFGKPMTCQLPVMDHRNKAIPNPDAFQVNTAIMRCMTKALSLHGLGLYIYAGEDLPEGEEKPMPDITDWLSAIDATATGEELQAVYKEAYEACDGHQSLIKQVMEAKAKRIARAKQEKANG